LTGAGYTVLRVTSLEAPDQGASDHVISGEGTFGVRVGNDDLAVAVRLTRTCSRSWRNWPGAS